MWLGRTSLLLVVRLTHAIKWANRLIISSLNVAAQSRGLYRQLVIVIGRASGWWVGSRDAPDCLCAPEMGQMSWHRDVAFWQREGQQADSNNMSMQLPMIWPSAETETESERRLLGKREMHSKTQREREWEWETIVKNHRDKTTFLVDCTGHLPCRALSTAFLITTKWETCGAEGQTVWCLSLGPIRRRTYWHNCRQQQHER